MLNLFVQNGAQSPHPSHRNTILTAVGAMSSISNSQTRRPDRPISLVITLLEVDLCSYCIIFYRATDDAQRRRQRDLEACACRNDSSGSQLTECRVRGAGLVVIFRGFNILKRALLRAALGGWLATPTGLYDFNRQYWVSPGDKIGAYSCLAVGNAGGGDFERHWLPL